MSATAPPCPPGARAARRQDRARHRRRRHRHRLRDREALRRGGRARRSSATIHERRLGEAADALAADRGAAPADRALRRHARGAGAALLDAADRRARAASTCSSTTPASAARADLVDMTDEQWHAVLDVTLNGTFRMTRAVLRHMMPRGARRDRQQRLGARLARAGRPGALRRRQGRASWRSRAAPRWRPPPPACASTPSRRASRCTRSSPR